MILLNEEDKIKFCFGLEIHTEGGVAILGSADESGDCCAVNILDFDANMDNCGKVLDPDCLSNSEGGGVIIDGDKLDILADAIGICCPGTEGVALGLVEATGSCLIHIGVKFKATELQSGIQGFPALDMIYSAMTSFASDLLQEAFSLKVVEDRYPDSVGVGDIYKALSSLDITDFLVNKKLGKPGYLKQTSR
ncbi:hypothetical protein ScPMuIL_012227 [Solemya velum]